MSPGAGRVDDGAGAEEEERLEEGVVHDVEERRRRSPRTARRGRPSARPAKPSPRPMTMIPTFSMLW